MNRSEILEICRRAKTVGAVKHEDYADYVVVMTRRKKLGDTWTAVEAPYMLVDGQIAMAAEDHRQQAKRLDYAAPTILIDNDDQLTLLVVATSEIYGTRHGIATSRKKTGTNPEKDFPWETAETSAIGRVLEQFGYGILPDPELMLRSTSSVRTTTESNGIKPSAIAGAMLFNSPATLLIALRQVTDYYNDANEDSAVLHVMGAIQKQMGASKYRWPAANDGEGWTLAYTQALQYARENKPKSAGAGGK